MKQNDLGRDKVGALLVRLAVPAITAQLINALYNIVDRMYIGHIAEVGDTALTGVGVTFPIIMLISAFSAFVGMGGAPRVAIKMGEGKKDEAEEIVGNSFITLIFISVILTAVFLLFGKPLLLMFGASTETLPYGLSYMERCRRPSSKTIWELNWPRRISVMRSFSIWKVVRVPSMPVTLLS